MQHLNKRSVGLLIALALCGCPQGSKTIALDLSSGVIDLAQQLPGAWTKVCLLPPYTNNQSAQQLLGFAYDVESNSTIASADDISLLLTMSETEVLNSYAIDRSKADFSSLGANCYTREEATFTLPKESAPAVSHP